MLSKINYLFLLSILSSFSFAQGSFTSSYVANSMFLFFIVFSLVLTVIAKKYTKSISEYFAASSAISPLENGLAIAGDYISAASFLGITGIVFLKGFDGLIYCIGFIVGWPVILMLISEPLRNLGKFTFADVLSYRFCKKNIRISTTISSLVTIFLYLIAQMVGSGKLIELLFGIDYHLAVILIGLMMMIYVYFGGMIATTWVQMLKAGLLISGASILAFLVLQKFGFSFEGLFAKAVSLHPLGYSILGPGKLITDPISALSLGVGLMFGTAGLPHILMRFFTVKDSDQANQSVLYATIFIGYFYLLLFIIGFGSIVFLKSNSQFIDANGTLLGGPNMAAIHLANALGGEWLMGFISAVAFATILAVVAGLTLSGASIISYDFYSYVLKDGVRNEVDELAISKKACIFIGIISIFLGFVFKNHNVAFMVGLAFAVAASANFPVLLMSIYWSEMTTLGAVLGNSLGLSMALILFVLGPEFWCEVLNFAEPIFPYSYPALFSMPISFIACYLGSKLDSSTRATKERALFEDQYRLSHSL